MAEGDRIGCIHVVVREFRKLTRTNHEIRKAGRFQRFLGIYGQVRPGFGILVAGPMKVLPQFAEIVREGVIDVRVVAQTVGLFVNVLSEQIPLSNRLIFAIAPTPPRAKQR